MILAVFARRLRPGLTIEDFRRAWMAESGFGAPARVFVAGSLDDPAVVLTVGFVDLEPDQLAAAAAALAEAEGRRHRRIDEVVEQTELRDFFVLDGEYDFSDEPVEIVPGSERSLLRALRPS